MTSAMLPYNQDYYTEDKSQTNGFHKSLERAIEDSQKLLLSVQFPEGYWWGELEANVTFTAETVLLYKILGIAEQYPFHKAENYLRRTQSADGGWEICHGRGGCLNCTIESYIALRLLNVPKTDPALQKARLFILSKGGIAESRMFTRICLALLGCYEWSSLPSLPPWLMLLPTWFPFNIYQTSSWARATLVPLIPIAEKKLVFKFSENLSFDELYTQERVRSSFSLGGDWKSRLFLGMDYCFKTMEGLGLVPLRERSLNEVTRWLLASSAIKRKEFE